jgi:hypothetical protein
MVGWPGQGQGVNRSRPIEVRNSSGRGGASIDAIRLLGRLHRSPHGVQEILGWWWRAGVLLLINDLVWMASGHV